LAAAAAHKPDFERQSQVAAKRTYVPGCPLEETLADSYPWCDEWEAELKRLFAAYVSAKQRDNVLDYDDLLLCWREAVQIPGIAAQMRRISITFW
jgi:superfamily I DNA/RNA helicase